MSTAGEQIPFEPSGEELIGVLQELDKTRTGFFDASAQYVRRPTTENSQQILEHAKLTTLSVSKFTKCVMGDSLLDAQQKGEIIANHYVEEEATRVAYFNSLFPGKGTDNFTSGGGKKEAMTARIIKALDTSAAMIVENKEEDPVVQLAEDFVDQFAQNLGVDVTQLVKLAAKTPKARLLNSYKSVGKHSLDVLKLSAAVAIGTTIAKQLEKQRKSS